MTVLETKAKHGWLSLNLATNILNYRTWHHFDSQQNKRCLFVYLEVWLRISWWSHFCLTTALLYTRVKTRSPFPCKCVCVFSHTSFSSQIKTHTYIISLRWMLAMSQNFSWKGKYFKPIVSQLDDKEESTFLVKSFVMHVSWVHYLTETDKQGKDCLLLSKKNISDPLWFST